MWNPYGNLSVSYVRYLHCAREKKSLLFSQKNFNKSNRIFAIFGTHYPDDMLYKNVQKFSLEIYLSLSIADVIATSSKMQLSHEGVINTKQVNF